MKIEDFRFISVAFKDRIATVTLQRPDMLNAVGSGMHSELSHVFRLLESHPDFDVVVITGAGGTIVPR